MPDKAVVRLARKRGALPACVRAERVAHGRQTNPANFHPRESRSLGSPEVLSARMLKQPITAPLPHRRFGPPGPDSGIAVESASVVQAPAEGPPATQLSARRSFTAESAADPEGTAVAAPSEMPFVCR